MSGIKSVSRHEEASAGSGPFLGQGGLIAQQNLANCDISTNLPSGWFYQDHRWSLINKYVVLIKPICGST